MSTCLSTWRTSVESGSLNFASKICEKEVNTCLCCKKLRLKLHKAKLKISSYEEILKLLQEERKDEGSCSQTNSMKQKGSSNNEQSQFSSSKDSWINVTSNLSNKSRIIHSNLIQLTPQTANKFEVLTKLSEESESSSASVVKDITLSSTSLRKNYQTKILSMNSSRRKSHKILMNGESHVRNCVIKLQHNLGANYEVSIFVKLGA